MDKNYNNPKKSHKRDCHGSPLFDQEFRDQEGSKKQRTVDDEKLTFRRSFRQRFQQNHSSKGTKTENYTSIHHVRHDNFHQRSHLNSKMIQVGRKRTKKTEHNLWDIEYNKQCLKQSEEQTTGQGQKKPVHNSLLNENPKFLKHKEGDDDIPRHVIIYHNDNTEDIESNGE